MLAGAERNLFGDREMSFGRSKGTVLLVYGFRRPDLNRQFVPAIIGAWTPLSNCAWKPADRDKAIRAARTQFIATNAEITRLAKIMRKPQSAAACCATGSRQRRQAILCDVGYPGG